jgi:preprotein translocase SecE subunit
MGKDDATWMKICYVAFALIVAYVAYKLIETLGIQFGWSERYEWFAPVHNIAALLVGAGTSVWMYANTDRREYHLAAVGEVRKVVWPKFPDVKKMTLIVVVVVSIFAVILTIFDVVWSKVLQFILPA